jgi:hypothetical protein
MIFSSHIVTTRICKQDYERSKVSIGCCWDLWVKVFYMTHPKEAYCNPVLVGGRGALSKAGKNKEESAQNILQKNAAIKGLQQGVKAIMTKSKINVVEEVEENATPISSSSSSNRDLITSRPPPLSAAISRAATSSSSAYTPTMTLAQFTAYVNKESIMPPSGLQMDRREFNDLYKQMLEASGKTNTSAPPSSSILSTTCDPSGNGLLPEQFQAWINHQKTPPITGAAAATTSSSAQSDTTPEVPMTPSVNDFFTSITTMTADQKEQLRNLIGITNSHVQSGDTTLEPIVHVQEKSPTPTV